MQCSPTDYINSGQHYTMQTLIHGRKIEDDKKQAILEMVSDKYCRAILSATMEKPKSATEITAETGTPISTVYRRLQTLHDNKLVGISGCINEDGKKHFLYKSKVKAILTNFNGDFIEMEIVPNKSDQSWENNVS
jgi:hypothetical protein